MDNLLNVKHTVVVLSGKGGVGKSTVASQLAVGLCKQGKKVRAYLVGGGRYWTHSLCCCGNAAPNCHLLSNSVQIKPFHGMPEAASGLPQCLLVSWASSGEA